MSELRKHIEEVYLGIPYKWGGKDLKGLDCSGFVYAIQQSFYDIENAEYKTASMLHEETYSIDEQPSEGDLVFFDTLKKGHATHVGLMINNKEFAHASSSKGLIISTLDNIYWKGVLIGFGKFL